MSGMERLKISSETVFFSRFGPVTTCERPALLNGPESPGSKSHSQETPERRVLGILGYFPKIPKTFFRSFFRVRLNPQLESFRDKFNLQRLFLFLY